MSEDNHIKLMKEEIAECDAIIASNPKLRMDAIGLRSTLVWLISEHKKAKKVRIRDDLLPNRS